MFFVVGLPGLLAAFAALIMSDPGRGASEVASTKVDTARPGMSDYLELLKTKTFVFNTLGMAAVTFATGAYAAWGSTFYQRIHGLTATKPARESAIAGRRRVDRNRARNVRSRHPYKLTKRAYLLLAAVAVLCAIPLGVFGILDHNTNVFDGLLVLRVGLAFDGAGTVQYDDGERRAAKPPGGRLCGIHLFHSPVRRHQLADSAGMDLRAVRQAERDGLVDRSVLRLDGCTPVDDTNLTVAMLSVAPVLLLGFLFSSSARSSCRQTGEGSRCRRSRREDLAQFHH